VHEDERGKKAFYNYDFPLKSGQDLIELASQFSLLHRSIACNKSGKMLAKGDSTTAVALQRSKLYSLRALRIFVVNRFVSILLSDFTRIKCYKKIVSACRFPSFPID
jgi:hypothetical protein